MFENIESAIPPKYPLLWASLRAILLGGGSFFPAFFLSLLITIPWSKHYWAGDGQAVLGGMAVSFFFAIAFAVSTAIFVLWRAIRGERKIQSASR